MTRPQESAIPLSPLASPRTTLPNADQSADHRQLDTILVVLVLAFAFLLASFPARNSDVWLHLGAGKLLAQGKYVFGEDPFASTTTGVYWANCSWLFDLIAYGVYSLFPDTGLVVGKALLLTLTAIVLILAGRGGRKLWVPSACAGLAILVVGVRMPLAPICFSYLFLAVLIWLLHRPEGRGPGEQEAAARPVALGGYWPIPLLFVLWVNLDGWFVLGLAVLTLYLAGTTLQQVFGQKGTLGAKRQRVGALGLIWVLALAACLVNPHYFHIFALPPELGLSAAYPILQEDPAFSGLLASPFEGRFFHSPVGASVSGLAYYGLFFVSLFAFALNARHLRWSHGLTWLGLFVLSAYQARAIPFFALVAGPITAHNFQAFHAARWGAVLQGEGVQRWSAAGRTLTAIVALLLLMLTWPGWLQSAPHELRSWNLETDGGLARSALQLRQWHEEGVLNAQTPGFVVSPETANQLAWLCPAEHSFVDSRLSLFPADAARDYVAVRAALLAGAPPADREAPDPTPWRKILRDRHIHHLIVHDTDPGRVKKSLEWLSARPEEFPLLYLQDSVAIFGWRDPESSGQADLFATLRVDLDRQAFHPPADKRAPAQWPGRQPRSPAWYDSFVKPRVARAADREEAAMYLAYFDAQRAPLRQQSDREWDASMAAAAVGFPGSGNLAAAVDEAMRFQFASAVRYVLPAEVEPVPTPLEQISLGSEEKFLFARDEGPPAAALLAVRAARRALHVNPDDARAYLLLGKAYVALASQTTERATLGHMESLEQIRRVQAVTAFNQALLLEPDLAEAHIRLAQLYLGTRPTPSGDLGLEHLRAGLKIYKTAGPTPGETAEQYKERITALEQEITDVEGRVNQALDRYTLYAANKRIVEQAKQAQQNGLPGKALELLLASDFAAFGLEGLHLELELLLYSGRVREVREWMEPEHADALGVDYYWLQTLLFAATGDYEAADADLTHMQSVAAGELQDRPEALRGEMAALVAQSFLDAANPDGPLLRNSVLTLRGLELATYLESLARGLRQQADLKVLRALLALEQGDDRKAEELLRECVEGTFISPQAVASGGGLDFVGRPLGQRYLQLLK